MRNVSAFQPKGATGLNRGLVSYWRLDESSGNASDSVGSNTLTNQGTTPFASALIGNGASFNGSSNRRLDIASNIGFSAASDRTWSFWINPSGLTTGYYFDNVNNADDLRAIVYPETNKFTFFISGNTVSTPTTVTTGNWYHVVVTKNSTTYTLYLNASSSGTVSKGGSTYSSDAFSIGAPVDSYGSLTNGIIDEVGIWNRALSATEVTELYNSTNGIQLPSQSLSTKAYYPLNKVQANPELASTSLFSDANLVSYWKLEGNSNDSKGSNNGTDTAITYGNAYGKFGQGALFNNTSSKIVLPNLGVSGGTARTISAWVNPTSVTSVEPIYSSGGGTTETNFSIFLGGNSSGDVYLSGSNNDYYTAGSSVSTGSWQHITVVYDGGTASTSTVHIYVNGVSKSLTKSGVGTGAYNTTNSNYTLGTDPNNPTRFFDGSIDDVAIFSRALSATEVETLYGYGTTALDYSGNGNHGTETAITYPQGRFGQAAKFNGSSSQIASTVTGQATFTMAGWIYPTSFASEQYFLIRRSVANNNNYAFNLQTSGQIRTNSYNGTAVLEVTGSTLKLNQWYSVVGIFDGTSSKIYVNGILVGSGTLHTVTSGSDLFIGANSASSYYTGLIDEVIIESRAWTAAEVSTYYRKSMLNYGKKSFGQMVWTYTSELLKGSYTLTGKNLNTLYNRVASLLKGAYTLTGKQLTANKAYVIQLLKGTYNLVGKLLGVPNRWNNQSKNTSTWTEETKNSSTWTNQDKS